MHERPPAPRDDQWRRLGRWFAGEGPAAAGMILLGVLLATLYAVVIRPWMQPDEPRHFEVALHVARLGRPVVGYGDRNMAWEHEIIADMEAQGFWWYGFTLVGWPPDQLPDSLESVFGADYGPAFFQAPLYYAAVGSLMRRWGSGLSLSESIIRLRLLGALFLGLSLVGIYVLTAELFPNQPYMALASVGLAALWPAHLAANVAVNNDPLVEVWVIWSLCVAVHLLRQGPDLVLLISLAALSALAVSTKRTGLVAPVIMSLALVFWILGWLRERRWALGRWRRGSVVVLGLILAAGSASAGVVLARRLGWLALPGDFAGTFTAGEYWRRLSEVPWLAFAGALWRTLLGWFGWMRVALPEPLYWLGGIACVAALLGWYRAWRRGEFGTWAGWQKRAMLLLGIAFLIQVGLVFGKEVIYDTWQDGSLPQARYLYPLFPAIALPLAGGWLALRSPLRRASVFALMVVVLLVFNAYVVGALLYPFFWL